ncbi:hypothetical protein [Nocardioides sp. GXZ039]|uniref:hypothetical protein n=1 Tax=Nocardioides sp. GXZ039 TaxID=3136018 RepID=UPI0030F42C18
MLNDIRWPTRALVAGFGLALGLIIGGPAFGTSGDTSDSTTAFALLFVGIAVELVVISAFPVWAGRAQRRFSAEVAAATDELAAGDVSPVPEIGRLVRARTERRHGWWLPVRGSGPAPSEIAVFVALGDEPPRRVAALVPPDLGFSQVRDVPAVLLVHPEHREAAVLDDRVTPDRLAEVEADPRWRTERLPSDRRVVGGYLPLGGALLLGIGTGLLIAALVLTLW